MKISKNKRFLFNTREDENLSIEDEFYNDSELSEEDAKL